MFLLIFIYPLIIKKATNDYINYLFIHLPFVLFVFIIMISFLTNRTYELSVQENETIKISDITNKMNIKQTGFGTLKLAKINLKNKNISSFFDVTLTNSKTISKVAGINKPIKIDNIKIYQKNWALGISEIIFTFENKEYNIFQQQDSPIKTKEGGFFELYPKDIHDNKILYGWNIYSKNKKLLDTGLFTLNEILSSKSPPAKYNFSIIKEEFELVSILQATYKPFNFILGLSSIIFLIILFFNLWGNNLFKKTLKF